ncbi:glycosyltransferase [Eilatimonas milleporae]|uniref:Glycosyltransferase involved in cell wall biosynthesis n=1 Tax=Eilatimonas milleporae TaxID=911205 RepID=A0A3M0CV38_9PROT|nr:glycosyltransferase [Eilatimonas milleporae]RMB12450.1 glycosyltransferase involved in cell wall biosynthesis [Eilatimonas milleporae]
MKILFIHNNFPGQYRRIYQYLGQFPDYEMAVATLATNKQDFDLPSVRYRPHREPRNNIHPSLVSTEAAVLMGQAAYKALLKVRDSGKAPDIILSHSGWGASLFLKDLFPDAKLLNYYEWYYHCHGSDGEFLRDEPYGPDDEIRLRMKNTPILQDLSIMDWGQSPTAFQHSQLPAIFHDKVTVLHDGVDTAYYCPDSTARIDLPDGRSLTVDDEVVTYVARGMEDYRGFPQFMEAIAALQKRRPHMHTVLLGADRVAYGARQPDGKGLKNWALKTFEFDTNRLHFLGVQPFGTFRNLMQVSSAHVYLTVPFVLSWSLMEAMSCGALIVGSDTAPVREVIKDGENGALVPFFEPEVLADRLDRVLQRPDDFLEQRKQARHTIVTQYGVEDILPRQRTLIEDVASGRLGV